MGELPLFDTSGFQVGSKSAGYLDQMRDATSLPLRIARCLVMEACLSDESYSSPCRDIVLHQWPGVSREVRLARWKREHHLPDRWVGHLTVAPLLFLSSNPNV